MKRFVYADNAATTRISGDVLAAMLPFLTEHYGNASSIYASGQYAARAVEAAREQVANALGATAREITFTSGGSESDNWAIKGICARLEKQGKHHLITSVFEHHAVLHVAETLAKQGWDVTYLSVDEKGYVNPEDVRNAIREDTALVTIMYANNEIGTIQPIAEIGTICKERGVLFHTDAVQAVGNVAIDVKAQNIDMLSLSGHKIHAQKGIGALYVRRGIVLPSFIEGGAQEAGRRAGTENVAAIVGLGVAITKAVEGIEAKEKRLRPLQKKVIDRLLAIDRTHLNGGLEHRLASNVNISFEGVEGESLLLSLDQVGIAASSGSACTSGSLDPSHVLLAIGLPHEIAHGSLRLSFGDDTTEEDVAYILEAIVPIIERLRAMSPLWERITAGENADCAMKQYR